MICFFRGKCIFQIPSLSWIRRIKKCAARLLEIPRRRQSMDQECRQRSKNNKFWLKFWIRIKTGLINSLTAGVRTTLAVEVAFKGPDENISASAAREQTTTYHQFHQIWFPHLVSPGNLPRRGSRFLCHRHANPKLPTLEHIPEIYQGIALHQCEFLERYAFVRK